MWQSARNHAKYIGGLLKLELVCIILFFSDIASTMPSADLGRIDLGDVTPHNIKLLRKVNTVVFPVSYHDKFYKVDISFPS